MALNIKLSCKDLYPYAQKYCFLNGPNSELNAQLRKMVRNEIVQLEPEMNADSINYIGLKKQADIEKYLEKNLKVPKDLFIRSDIITSWIKHYGWKLHLVKNHCENVLVIGSASCKEAIFLRHYLPNANITCIDFENAVIPNIEASLNIDFIQGDFDDLLMKSVNQFDLIFANHVLEHFYHPIVTLGYIRQALRQGGQLIAALPLLGQTEVPFNGKLDAKQLHPVDFCILDIAHAWKTNVTDLQQHLTKSGFIKSVFFVREGFFSTGNFFKDKNSFYKKANLGYQLNMIILNPIRYMVKTIFPKDDVPNIILKIIFGIENRLWFGSNRLINNFSQECLVIASV